MVVIKEYFNPVELSIIKEKLDEADIYYVTTDVFFNNQMPDLRTGIKLFVNEEDKDKAKEIIEQEYPADTSSVEDNQDTEDIQESINHDNISELSKPVEEEKKTGTVEKKIGILAVLFFFTLIFVFTSNTIPMILFSFIHAEVSFVTDNIHFLFSVFSLFTTLFILYFALRKEKEGIIKSLDLNPFPFIILLPVILLTIGLFFITSRILDFIQAAILQDHFLSASQFSWNHPKVDILNFIIPGIIIAPIFEELFFRGFVLKWSLKYISPNSALFLSAILFGFMHIESVRTINAIIFGIFAGVLYMKTKSVYPCIFVHFLWNTMVKLFRIYYPINYEEYLLSYKQLDNLSLYDGVGIICFILGSFFFVLYLRKSKKYTADEL